jgi:hypothetical protein
MCRSIDFRCIRPFELRGKEPPDAAYVSFSPSKIPYNVFSPVQLQTGFQPLRPSTAWLVKPSNSAADSHPPVNSRF